MKAILDREDFAKWLGLMIRVAGKRNSPMPYLSHFVMEAGDNGVLIAATDLSLTLQAACKGTVETGGKVTAPARKVYDVVRLLPQEMSSVEIISDGRNGVSILTDHGNYSFPGFPPDEFPIQAIPDGGNECNVEVLARAIERTIKAVPPTDHPLSSAGLHWLCDEETGNHLFVACSINRLFSYSVDAETFGLEPFSSPILLPRENLDEILRFLRMCDRLSVSLEDQHIRMVSGDVKLSVRVISEPFPYYRDLVSSKKVASAKLPVQPLQDAVKRLSIFTDQTSKDVMMQFQEGKMVLEAGNRELGIGREVVELLHYEGQRKPVRYNLGFVRDALEHVEGEQLRLEWDERDAMFVLDLDDPGFMALLLPIIG